MDDKTDVDIDEMHENLLYVKAILHVAIPENVDISTLSNLLGLAEGIIELLIKDIEGGQFGYRNNIRSINKE